MSNQKNSFISMMEQIALLNKNNVEAITKLTDVVSAKSDSITLSFVNNDGTRSTYEMPTVAKLKNDIDVANANIKRLSGFEGQTYIIDGQTSKRVYTVDLNREPADISDIGAVTKFVKNQNWFFESLMNPILSVKIDLTDKIDDNVNKILSRRYVVRFQKNADGTFTTAGQTALNDFSTRFLGKTNIKIDEFLSWYTNPTNVGVLDNTEPELNLDEQTFELNFKQLNYKGTFSILKIETDNINNKIWYHIDTLQYEGRDGTKRSLKIGDYLILNKKGSASKYVVREISNANSLFKLRLERSEGYDPIPVGQAILEYYSPFVADKSVNISIGYDEYNVVFVKPINTENNVIASLWSYGTSFYTNNLILDTDQNVDLVQFYTSTVKDYGDLLRDMVKRFIPATKGITPNIPSLNVENFKVVQINKHITDSDNAKTLQQLHAQKNNIKTKLQQIQDAIINKNKELNTRQFSSAAERTTATNELNTLLQNQQIETNKLASVTQQITDARALTQVSEEPKFRVRGFFSMPEAQSNQEVIQFRIQYRYSSKDGKVNPSEGFETTDLNGNITNGYFSNWNEYLTDVRNRTYDVTTDSWIWDVQNISDADAPNINQIDIDIRNGEQVEFRVKSISEAGWPDAALESDWSETITVQFPDEFSNLFRQTDFIYEQSIKDEALVQMNNDLNSRGIYRHVQDQYFVNETFVAHKDTQIATSFTDDQGKAINLFTYLQSLQSRLTALEEQLSRTKGEVLVSLFKGNQQFKLENNSTFSVMVDCEDYGRPVFSKIKGEYYNDVYIIKDYYLQIENVSESNPLGLLSDRKYVNSEANTFFSNPSGMTIFVDEENNMHIQQDYQFIWFADKHNDVNLNSGLTGVIPPCYPEHINALKDYIYNLGVNSGSNLYNDNILPQTANSILNNICWVNSANTTITDSDNKLMATIHPMVKDPSYIVDAGQDKVKTIAAKSSIIVPINIYFRFSDSSYSGTTGSHTWKVPSPRRTEIKTKQLKFFIEKEGEQRPLQYTIAFKLRRYYDAQFYSRVISNPRSLFS